MIVIEKNEGPKIPYSVSGTKLSLDDELILKLSKYQKDWAVHKDICTDRDGNLTLGVGEGYYYVAEIDIPPREYEEPESDESVPTALPLDMEKVTLTLWALVNREVEEEEEEEA